MASVASGATAASLRGKARGTVDAATAAWLCAIPCAAIVAVAILVLGPPLGDLLQRDAAFTFLPSSAAGTFDESTEHARYLIALGAPLLLTLATWWTVRYDPPLPARAAALVVPVAQLALAALVVVCVVAQYRMSYGTTYTRVVGTAIRERYFNPATLVAAAFVAGSLLLAVRSEQTRTRVAGWLRESPSRRWGALATALVLTVVWMLHAVNTEESIASVLEAVRYHL
jgi:hypothetical protein